MVKQHVHLHKKHVLRFFCVNFMKGFYLFWMLLALHFDFCWIERCQLHAVDAFAANYKQPSWLLEASRLSTICSHKPVLQFFGV